jgi:hypothetical protein
LLATTTGPNRETQRPSTGFRMWNGHMRTLSPTSVVLARQESLRLGEKPLFEHSYEESLGSLDRKPRAPSRALSRSLRPPSLTNAAGGKQQRRVQFRVDNKHRIVEEDIPRSEYPLDPHVCWWTAEEMDKIQGQAACVAEFCMNCRPDYSRTALDLLAFCAAAHQGDQRNLDHAAFSQDPAVASFVSGTARGLEQTLVPLLKSRRKQTLRTTLEFQERVRRLSVDQQWDLIARQYKAHSAYASLWSRVLADGDARVRACCCGDH